MPAKEQGVTHYAWGKGFVRVPFPNGEIRCQHCRFCTYDRGLSRAWCRLADREVYNPAYGIEGFCPLQFE